MRSRQSPKAIPNRWPFVRASVPDVGEPLVFRLPRSTRMADVFKGYTSMFVDGSVPVENVDRLPVEAAKVVARLWAHPVMELESPPDDGDAVLDELHDFGVSEAVVIHLATGLFSKCADRAISEQEVASRADFFGAPTPERSTLTSCTSNASDGSGTTAAAAPGTT